jgi:hypothetical protein
MSSAPLLRLFPLFFPVSFSLVLGCGSAAPKPSPASASAPAAAVSAPVPQSPPYEPYPTRKNAGAGECRTALHDIGPAAEEGHVVMGFGPQGGLTAWSAPNRSLVLRPITASGEQHGEVHLAPMPKSFLPRHVIALDNGFFFIGAGTEWEHSRWYGLATDALGRPLGAAVELDLEHRFVEQVSRAQGRSFTILATRALMVPREKEGTPARWLDITVAPDGKIKAQAEDLDFSKIESDQTLIPVAQGDKQGWFIARQQEKKGSLVLGGDSRYLSREKLAEQGIAAVEPQDILRVIVSMSPRGGRFLRAAGNEQIGAEVQIPPGLFVLMDNFVWSGSHWVVGHANPARSPATAYLFAIDCR